MKIREFIQKCGITISGPEGKEDIKATNSGAVPLNVYVSFVRDQRSKVIAEVKAMAAEGIGVENAEKIKGLNELENAINAWSNYYRERERRWEDEALSSFLPAEPEADIEELKAKYPRAAAYIRAENYRYASHYAKAAAGKRAMERITAGEDHDMVIAEMEAEWTAHCEEHVWD